MKEVLCEVSCILTLLLKSQCYKPIILCCFSRTTGKKGNWKPYQQDREGLELIQRLQDPATARPEYWGECPTSTHPESVHLKEKNKSVRKS